MFNPHIHRRPPVIVFGNEKGGTGKSTLAMHLAVALLNRGLAVATIDLDSEQRTLSRYIANRRRYRTRNRAELPIPEHMTLEARALANDATELATALAYYRGHDAIIVDTPGYFTTLAQAGHIEADVLVTPVNDSLVDVDVLTESGIAENAYGRRMAGLRERRTAGRPLDWIVVRNRMSTLAARNKRVVGKTLGDLSHRLGFRVADGILERVIYRELFLDGLTVEDLSALSEDRPVSLSHVAARQELRNLIACLALDQRQAA